MQKDLVEASKDPLRYMARKGKSFLSDPVAMRSKAKHYAIYDLVHIFNELMKQLQVGQSVIERLASRLFSFPAARFLGMKRTMSWLVSNSEAHGAGTPGAGHVSKPHFDSMAKSATVAAFSGHYHHALSMSDRI